VNQGITLADPVLFYPPIALDRGSGAAAETLYYGTNKLYKAPRFFTTAPSAGSTTVVFTALAGAADVTGGGMCGSTAPSLSAIESVANPAAGSDAAILYVGSCSGHVLRSTDGGAGFTEVDAGGSAIYVSAIAVDPASNGQVVWVARSGYAGSAGKNVRRSTDGGATWASAANGIPDVPVNHILVDPNDHTRVFAATDIGVYVTIDGGATWGEAAPGIPRVAVWRLAASTLPAGSGALLAATYGRGVYRLSPLSSGSGPALSVSPSALDFGNVTPGSSADRSITVTNTGSGALVGTASVSGSFAVVSGGSFNLAGGQSQGVAVRFAPTVAGFASSSVAFSSNGGSASVNVSGTGSSVPSTGGATVVVPVVLSVAGLNDSFFTSELTLTNRAAVDSAVELTYTAAFGGGSGAAVDSLGAGRQKIVPDAMAYLRSLGVPVPTSGTVGGTLRVRFRDVPSADLGAVTVRTATTVPEGRAGLAYPGLSSSGLLTGTSYLCGLRQNATDRSNVAVINAGAPGDGDVVLRLTVFSGDPSAPISGTLPDISLSPGGFSQISGVLQSNGLVLSNGYVKVERVAGSAPYFAYGVINDQANSDGSFVVPFPENALAGRTGLTLPVVVEAGAFSTELVLANTGSSTRTGQLTFVADAVTSSGNAATLSRTLGP
ncbi:MAG TPA: choice-of-anchor D domain-containing protein, partial [Thermoanaerobaculia bacterium]|nr:choice-of-anchor D domain-containing protein [Thermoanaerobaculia bacterium]